MRLATAAMHDLSDVRSLLARLSQADRIRLVLVGQRFAFGCAMSPDDLLQEACSRALAGTRKWRDGLELRAFLAGAMRSIAFDERKKAGTHALDMAVVLDAAEVSIDAQYHEAGTGADVESETEAKETIALLQRLVKNNDNAALVMEGILDDMKPTEIRAATGLTQTQYDSARTYIHRRLDAHFKKQAAS
jgi:DNA-directed RNA polymerase specialized sigma24 family protein